jgi:hypothetical protein
VTRGSPATGPGYAGTRTAVSGPGPARWTLVALAQEIKGAKADECAGKAQPHKQGY